MQAIPSQYTLIPEEERFRAPVAEPTEQQKKDTLDLIAKTQEIAHSYIPHYKPPSLNPQYQESTDSSRSSRLFDGMLRLINLMPIIHWDNSTTNVNFGGTHVNVNERGRTEQDPRNQRRREENYTLWGIAAFAGAVFATFFAAKTAATEGEEQEVQKLSYQDLKNKWAENKLFFTQCSLQVDIDRIVEKVDVLVARARKDYLQKMFLFGGGIVGCSTGMAAAILKSRTLYQISLGISICVVILAVYKFTFAYFSKRNEREANGIITDVLKLKEKHSIP